jgi:hypothetical protein
MNSESSKRTAGVRHHSEVPNPTERGSWARESRAGRPMRLTASRVFVHAAGDYRAQTTTYKDVSEKSASPTTKALNG